MILLSTVFCGYNLHRKHCTERYLLGHISILPFVQVGWPHRDTMLAMSTLMRMANTGPGLMRCFNGLQLTQILLPLLLPSMDYDSAMQRT